MFCTLLLVGNLHAVEPLAQDFTVVFHNPDPEYYVEGPGLTRLDDGTLLAVVPIVPREEWSVERRREHSVTHILNSTDGGKTWQEISTLPYYSAVPWTHNGKLYLFANKPGLGNKRNEDLELRRSENNGRTWSEPLTIGKGNYWNCHTSMAVKDGFLYWAVDDLSLGKKRGPRLVAGDLNGDVDIMSAAAWRMSDPLPFPGAPEGLYDPAFVAQPDQYLEPNVLEVKGRLRLLLATKLKRPTVTGICSVVDASDKEGKLELKFNHFQAMPGGHLKFCVVRDEKSGLYWATSNQGVDSEDAYGWARAMEGAGKYRMSGNDRRFLMLSYSMDALNWFPAGCIAQAGKLSQSFMYAKPVVDGEDLILIARSSIKAPNQHDADHATFHRVKDFRKLALELKPVGE